MALTGLNRRQDLETLVEGTEAAWKESHRVGFLDKQELGCEEVFQMHQFGVAGDDGIRVLLEGEEDVDADAVFAAGADVAGFHDAAGGPGYDHEAGFGHAPA